MMLIAGFVLLLLGLTSGSLLLASALGWMSIAPATALWILFPAGSGTGLLMAALGARTRTLPVLLRMTAGLMLALALIAVTAVVLSSAGMISIRHAVALWYVFGVGLVAGSAGFLMSAPPGEPA